MQIVPTSIPEVVIVEPRVFADGRGFFLETYQQSRFAEVGIAGPFVQDNHSGSQQNVLRGLHYQVRQPQGKLVRAIAGTVFDVAVDLRRPSPTFGRWVGALLSAENKRQMWVPPGFAHGFYVVSAWAEVIYKVTDYWAPEWERTLLWNDPQLAIDWPLTAATPVLAPKDAQGKRLAEAEVYEGMMSAPSA
ncbi:MAG: dTDP-4-dehydrorhamnose 3,5-epimerase [Gemmataceae bacterium]|nr:dTDP-4-dehydrorhamnose 3,5-epimerase [Gemmataceae bacterium]